MSNIHYQSDELHSSLCAFQPERWLTRSQKAAQLQREHTRSHQELLSRGGRRAARASTPLEQHVLLLPLPLALPLPPPAPPPAPPPLERRQPPVPTRVPA